MVVSRNGLVAAHVLIPLLGVAVWGIALLLPRLAYRLPANSWRKTLFMLLLNVGIWAVFILQVKVIDRFFPYDESHLNYFDYFVLIEAGGFLILLFLFLFRERARSRGLARSNVALTKAYVAEDLTHLD
jgi:hypothetical protein